MMSYCLWKEEKFFDTWQCHSCDRHLYLTKHIFTVTGIVTLCCSKCQAAQMCSAKRCLQLLHTPLSVLRIQMEEEVIAAFNFI